MVVVAVLCDFFELEFAVLTDEDDADAADVLALPPLALALGSSN